MNTPRDTLRQLNQYFCLTYIVVLINAFPLLRDIEFSSVGMTLFSATVFVVYGVAYVLPAYLLSCLALFGFTTYRKMRGVNDDPPRVPWVVFATALGLATTTQILLYADRLLFSLYRMHFNGFVWNLITTPGGIESLGSEDSVAFSYGFIMSVILVVQAALMFIVLRSNLLSRIWPRFVTKRRTMSVAALLLVAFATEQLSYGISHLRSYEPILYAAQSFPLYTTTTIRGLAKKLGFDVKRTDFRMRTSSNHLNYPLTPLEIEIPEKPLNVVWLVSESLRWDMLDPEIMPATWAFSEKAHRFEDHYSGGNGTRMGIFTMFYGIFGNSWFAFLDARKGPVLLDAILQEGYDFNGFTSARFSYPEFDKTVFTQIPDERLHELPKGLGWELDRENIGNLVASIRERDTSKPFMSFMFFESPHARYYFPDSSIIREPYLEDFNYATMNLDRDIDLIKNRYINSCHHLDTQIARVLEVLEEEDLLDNTIVLITGDHGEEFMEKGLWGHNSEFHQEQIRVPFVLWVPGTGHSVETKMTSHLDIAATLGPLLGIKNPTEDYTLGIDMFGSVERDYTIISDWNRMGFVDQEYKATFPVSALVLPSRITDRDDRVKKNSDEFFASRNAELVQVLKDASRFSR